MNGDVLISWMHNFVDALRCVRAAYQNMAANNHPLALDHFKNTCSRLKIAYYT